MIRQYVFIVHTGEGNGTSDTIGSRLIQLQNYGPIDVAICHCKATKTLKVGNFLNYVPSYNGTALVCWFNFTRLVLVGCILRPTVIAVLSTLSVFSCVPFCEWERRQYHPRICDAVIIDEAASSSRVVSPRTSNLGRSLVAFFTTQSMTTRNCSGGNDTSLSYSSFHVEPLAPLSIMSHTTLVVCIHLTGCLSPFLQSHISAVHYVIWRDFFVQIDLGVEIANLGGE